MENMTHLANTSFMFRQKKIMVTNHFDKVEMRVYNIAVVIAFSCQTSKKKKWWLHHVL